MSNYYAIYDRRTAGFIPGLSLNNREDLVEQGVQLLSELTSDEIYSELESDYTKEETLSNLGYDIKEITIHAVDFITEQRVPTDLEYVRIFIPDKHVINREAMQDATQQKSITFLKELQKELRNQPHDCQASPRFWVIRDYQDFPCEEGYQDKTEVNWPDGDFVGDFEELKEDVLGDDYDLSEEAKEDLDNLASAQDAVDWIYKHFQNHSYIVYVQTRPFIIANTLFLTKKEAIQHIKANSHHYTSRVHTYAMTAWRSPEVEKLWNILEFFDWDAISLETPFKDVSPEMEYIQSQMSDEVTCFNCKYYETDNYVCMKNYKTMCVSNERKTALSCSDFKKGPYSPEDIEKEYKSI